MGAIAFPETIIIIIACFFGSLFNLPDKNVQRLMEQSGGFLYGVCHPNENYEMLGDAGLKWVRFDIPYPYNQSGEISGHHLDFKARAKGYTDRGFKVMAFCRACGHTWCPFETNWGLFNLDSTPKPAYYAVKEIISGM